MENNVQWTREELKRRSKGVLRLHYWRLVLVTFLLALFIGSGTVVTEFVQPIIEGVSQGYASSPKEEAYEEESIEAYGSTDSGEEEIGITVFLIVISIAVVVIMFVMIVVVFAVSCLIINPLCVGSMRFYIRSFEAKPQFKEMFFAFDNRYKNIVVIMLLRDLYTIFWTLLFIVPGIIKSYEYSMIPYLLAENPNLTAKEAFAISKQMMKGNKWNAFVLDLSFFGWQILSILTLGVLGIFYVDPYVQLTGAALYRRLKGADCIPENIYYDGMEKDAAHGWYKGDWYREKDSEGGRINGVSNSDSGR